MAKSRAKKVKPEIPFTDKEIEVFVNGPLKKWMAEDPQRISLLTTKEEVFPKYLMKISGKRKFLPFAEAVTAYASGMAEVSFGRYVLHADFSVEEMTQADKTKISEATDRYEAAK